MFHFTKKTQYLISIFSLFIGITGLFFFYKDTEKQDTLTFLLQEEKNEGEKQQSFLGSFITPTINKYNGPVTESLLTCMDGYDTTKIKNIYPLDKLDIENGSVSVYVPPSHSIMQNREQILREIMPVFGYAVKNNEINWTWNNKKRVYTFKTYPGDEALWYCYFRKETIFFTNFFQITQSEQIDPLPPVSDYRVESSGSRIVIDWDYDYSQLEKLLKSNMIEFILEYKKASEGDFAWKKSKKIGFPRIFFENKTDANNSYWGEAIEYGETYDIKLSVHSLVDWYSDSKPLIFQIKTDELQFGYDIADVQKINKNIPVTLYALKDSNGGVTYSFHPELEKDTGNAFINIYDENHVKKYIKNLHIINSDKYYLDDDGKKQHAYNIQKEIQIDKPGVYTAKMCFGTTADDCIEYGLPSEIEILDFTCHEVFPGHNKKNADRINIVFIGSRYKKFTDFLAAVRESLTWDGKPAVLSKFNEELQKNKVYDLEWGLFAIEPFKSNKDKFNLWYVDEPMTTLTNTVKNICGLPYEYDAIYANRSFLGMLGRTRSFTYKAKFGENRTKGDPDDMFTYSHNYMPYDEFGTHELDYELFAHETGHAVFGLDDEYPEGDNRDPRYGEVSCVKTQKEAEKKWGDLIGQVDPFWNTVKTDMIKYDVNSYEVSECKRKDQNKPESAKNPCLTDDNNNIIYVDVKHEKYPKSYFITQYFKGGCLADYGDKRVIKPTEHSLMSYNLPILGSVNRREVERVLQMFTGEKRTKDLLRWPIDCTTGIDCTIGYPDIDADGKAANCGKPGYKGHEGTDIDITFSQMDDGIDVYSALDGEVLWVFDGKYDRCEYPNTENKDCQDPISNPSPNSSDGYRVCTDLGKYSQNSDDEDAFWCFDGGNVVVIRHKDSHKIFATRYDHLKKDSILVKKGDIVKKGQKIAEVGSSGKATGPHLHFEVWGKTFYDPIDPWSGSCGNPTSLWEK